jgi:hypothetical protein
LCFHSFILLFMIMFSFISVIVQYGCVFICL